MTTHEARCKALKDSIRAAVADADQVICQLPGDEPVGLREGMAWLEDSVRRGLRTDYHVVHDRELATVWLKRWSPDEVEPDWPGDWPEERASAS